MNMEAQSDHPTALGKNAPIEIHLMQAQDIARWDSFVNSSPKASFFHRAGWQAVIEQAFGHKTWFYYAQQEGQIVGILPLAEIKSILFGHSLSSLPFCVYGGVVANTEDVKNALDQTAISLAERLQVGHLEYRHIQAQNPTWLSKELYVTFRKTIASDEEANMLAIPRKQRAMVRKGIKFGLCSELDEDINRFFYAYSSSVHRLGTPVFSKKFFRLLKETFAEDCEIMTIVKDDRTIASVMSFYFRDEVLPYYGGGTIEARDLAANDFMYWELMRRAGARGIKVFDFGRSKLGTGAFDFKKNWGFEPEPLHYEYRLQSSKAIPENNPLNPKYQLFIKLWQRMPISFANLIGPHIVKNLG
ncbi:FemAB family XrtA/PEP-CTERM system-associated protein [Undibacterium parvum]|uniref:FemAB family PEP-CTERM system-associated protein n=1 Tax=Undibacterium parvum TaxID=401471 RepID=A0A3Q9BQV5_9BURK|nr:FemAB family XrtA/PEP-CTERM system-associated protein [Undibacterium parvum]AZP12237.1 FemAB family PEP-CTERM system-associated protein [Undibacterium parvum]